jgi:hypothetical protein
VLSESLFVLSSFFFGSWYCLSFCELKSGSWQDSVYSRIVNYLVLKPHINSDCILHFI